MSLDYERDVLETIGGFGTWQKRIYIILLVPIALCGMAVFIHSLIAYVPQHRCRIPQCENDVNWIQFAIPSGDSCHRYVNHNSTKCLASEFSSNQSMVCDQGWVADTSIFHSLASIDFEMVCEGEWKKPFAQSMYMTGSLLGGFIFGLLADWTGRRNAIILTGLLVASSGSICALLPASSLMYPVFVALRFLMGMGHAGCFNLSFTLVAELIGPSDKRTLCGSLLGAAFGLGGAIAGIVAWAGIRDWQLLMLVCFLPGLACPLLYFVIPESPRWLITKGKIDDLKKDVQKAAKINKTAFPEDAFEGKILPASNNNLTYSTFKKGPDSNKSKVGLWDLFKPAKMFNRTICMFYNWMVIALCFYGTTVVTSDLTSHVFVNYILVIAIEVPANFFCIYAIDKFGRKPVLALFSQILTGMVCILAGILTSSDPWAATVLAIIGKFGASCGFIIVFFYTAEMYPTEIRSSVLGISSTWGSIGGILAPQVANLKMVWTPLPFFVMGSLALLAGMWAFISLPETLGKKLPESMDESLQL